MGSVLLPDVSGIQNFDISDSTGLSARWKRWLRAFQLFAAGKGVTDVDQKYALLLHTAGMNVQDIFFTLPEGAGEGAYEKAVSALDAYFTPLSNAPYERSIFRSMIQSSSETIEQYITRLRQRADTCDFGNQNAIDERIRDQIIDKCLSHHLRRKLLEKGRTLTLANVRSIAKAMEDSERQAKSIEGQGQVNMIQSKGKQYGKNSFNSGNKSFNSGNKSTCTATCYSCGREGHIRTDPSCPARGKKCRKCKIVGHFDKVCKTKDKSKHGKIRQVVEQPQNNTDDEEYVFSMIGVNQINSVCDNIVVNIGNVNLKMIIDSGASCNIMGINLWNYLKDNHVKCVSSKSTKSLFAYGSEEPLKIAGIFTATVQCNNRTLNDIEFVVIEGKGQALLSRNTAEQLGVLQLVHSVSEPGTIKDKYPECFTGVGKLKSFQLQIPIDPDVEPIIQPMRRVPFNLRDKLGKKLDELLDLDIIEHVNEPSQWVSPVVVVPKRSAQESTPVAMTTREIERASENDPELKAVRECLVHSQWHRIEFKEYLPIRSELCAIGQLVLRGTRIVIPISLREQVLQLAHEGHPGIVVMKTRLRSKVWWPGIDKSIEKFCRSCYGCQLVSQPSKPEPLKRTELPSAPWQHLAADLLGPLPSNHYMFVLVDYYSRYFEVAVTKNISSENITSLISKFCLTHGLPLSIHTDNGPQFVSQHFKNFMSEHGIVHHRTTPLWPQANGEVERQNRSIMKRVKIAQAEGRDWKLELSKFLIMYRSTAHSTTGVSPSELLFGRKIRTKLPELIDYNINDFEVRDRDAEQKEKGKIYADKRRGACESDIRVDDQVLVRQDRGNKMSTPFVPSPFKVVEKIGNSVLVESDQGVQYRRNVTHLKKFIERENNDLSCSQSDANKNVVNTESEIISSHKDDFENLNESSNFDENKCLSSSQDETCSMKDRPVRVKRLPSKFDDFVLK
ncbi:unnamed protein product [Mytilus edulis]|uniref:Integrase catalytic domain-containing protein n=1 Tax=Mytilus edulis TaxID=6550 RepID=A0A8S3PXH4_MYTED|nr:unnamed protein product [Mytilus edulis]